MILPEESTDTKQQPRSSSDSSVSFTEFSPHPSGDTSTRWDTTAYEIQTASGRTDEGVGLPRDSTVGHGGFVRGLGGYGARLDTMDDGEMDEVLPPYTPRSAANGQSRRNGLLRAFRSREEDDTFTEAEYSDDEEDGGRDPTSTFRRRGGPHGRRGRLAMLYDKSPPAHRARVRFIRGFLYAAVLYAATWMVFGWGMRRWVWPDRGGDGGHGGGGRGGGGGPWGRPPGSLPSQGDGEPVGCAEWHVGNSMEFDPRGWKLGGMIGEDPEEEAEEQLGRWNYRSINTTFSIPLLDNITTLTEDGKRRWLESFIHLNGPYSIGDVSVQSVEWEEEKKPEIGVLVQAIYRTTPVEGLTRRSTDESLDEDTPNTPDTPNDPDRSTPDTPNESDIPSTSTPVTENQIDGWEELKRTSVCLMRRTGKENDTDSETEKRKNEGWEDPFAGRPGMGLGIYTEAKFNETTRSDDSLAPLQFRLFVTIPVPLKSSRVDGKRQISIPFLDIRGSLVTMLLGDLKDVTFGMLSLRTAIGNVEMEHVVADHLNVQTAGSIKGHISVSNIALVDSPMSDIDLDVSLLDSVHGSLPWSGELEHVPPFKDHRPPPPPSGPEGPGRKDRDDDMPLHVRVKTSKGNIKMKFVEWEMGQRLLRNRVESALGNIEVYHNASYVGPFSLSTTLGKVDLVKLEVEEDPLGLNRQRVITSTRNDKIGEKTISGTIEWRNSSSALVAMVQGDSGAEEHRPGPYDFWTPEVDLRTTLGNVKLVI